jgi:hypothetical protein
VQGNERAAKALAEMESKMKELSEEDAKLAHQEFLKQVIIRKWSFLGEKSINRSFFLSRHAFTSSRTHCCFFFSPITAYDASYVSTLCLSST